MADFELSAELLGETRTAWHRYLDLTVPFRPQLHRYCRRLTGDIWDAEDLVQDTLLKGFATLASLQAGVANPHGYLTRIATNLWIDTQRRRAAETVALTAAAEDQVAPPSPVLLRDEVRDAGARLLEQLAPQERAAVVLKEVFEMSLQETAEILATSVGAVKAALHRGRERLKEEPRAGRRAASKALVDQFVARLEASDLPGMLALMLDTGCVEMPGADLAVGRSEFERKGGWLWQSVHVHPDLPPEVRPPKWVNDCIVFQGEPVMLSFMPLPDGRVLQAVARFEEAEDKIARIRSYCFSPETAAEIADALGLKVGWIPYRFPTLPPAAA